MANIINHMQWREKILLLFFIITITISSILQDTTKATENKNRYEIQKIGMTIELKNDFYDIIKGMEENDEKVSDLQEYKQNFEQTGIVLDAIDSLEDNATKEVIVALSKNISTKQVSEFKNVSEDQVKDFSESFFNSLKQQNEKVEFIETKVISTSNQNKYMMAVTKTNTDEKVINSATYYTIANQQLIGITIRYLDKDIDWQETQEIIESTEFNPIDNAEVKNRTLKEVIIIDLVLIIIVGVIVSIKIYKNKKGQTKITEKQEKKFAKLNGFLMLYFLTIIYNTLLRAVLITSATELEDMNLRRMIIIQGIVNMVAFIWLGFELFRKKKDAPKNIIKVILGIGIINLIATTIQIVYTIKTTSIQDINAYLIQGINTIVSIILYTTIWTAYFKTSKRVNIYFQGENENFAKYKEKKKKVRGV